MFNECLDIRWKTAHFCILNFSFKNDFVWEEISNIRHSVSSPDETLHLMFDILLQIIVSHFVRIYGLDSFKSIKHSQLIWHSHTRTKLKQLSFLYVVWFRGISPLDLHNYSYHTRPYSIIVIYYIIFPVGGTPYPDWNEWKVVYEIKVNKHRMSQPEHISDEL